MPRILRLLCCVLLLAANLTTADLTTEEAEEIRTGLAADTRETRLMAVHRLAEKRGPLTLEVLLECFAHPEWQVREAAIGYLAEQDEEKALTACQELFDDRDPRVRGAVLRCVARLRGTEFLDQLARAAESNLVPLRANVARALGSIPYRGDDVPANRRQLKLCAGLLADPVIEVRIHAVRSLAALGDHRAVGRLLVEACGDPSEEVALQAATALSERAVPGGEVLAKHLKRRERPVRVAACLALGEIGDATCDRPLLEALGDREWQVRAAAAEGLGAMAPEDGARRAAIEKRLLDKMGDPDHIVRASVAWALARLGSRKAVRGMIALLEHEKPEAIRWILEGYTGRNFDDATAWAAWWKRGADTHGLEPPDLDTVSELDYYGIDETLESVVFVIDTSGSMRESGKLRIVKEDLWTTARELSFGTRFNLVSFASSVHLWNEGPLRASWRNKLRVKMRIDTLLPKGATDIHGALREALDQWNTEAVYFLTDGLPTAGKLQDQGQIIQAITARNDDRPRRMRLHTIGFQIPQATPFLTRLAEGNGGKFKAVK